MSLVDAKDLCAIFNKAMKDGWGVVPGFDGQVLTQTMAEEKIQDDAVRRAASKWIGKHVADAGGIFAYAFRLLGIADRYTADGSYIKSIFQQFCSETGKLPKGGLLPGTVLFKKRGDVFFGVGLYIGNSMVIEAKNVKMGIVSDRMTTEWTYWGKLRGLEYEELQPANALQARKIGDMRVLRGPVSVVGGASENMIRKEKHMSSEVIDVLPPGTSANVIEDCGEFCRIQYTKTGYIKKQNLKEVTSK